MNAETFKKIHAKQVTKYMPKMMEDGIWEMLPELERGEWLLSVLSPLIEENKVLDLCSSFGMFGAYLHKVEEMNFNYTCVDYEESRVKFGMEYFKKFNMVNATFHQHDVRKSLPFVDNCFDVVFLFGWWPYKIEEKHLLQEVSRVLKHHGFFYLDNKVEYYKLSKIVKALEENELTIIRLDMIKGDRADQGIKCVKGMKQ